MPVDASCSHRGEAEDPPVSDGNVGHTQLELELVGSRVVLEEPVERWLVAREATSVVASIEGPDLNRLHASARGAHRWEQEATRVARPDDRKPHPRGRYGWG